MDLRAALTAAVLLAAPAAAADPRAKSTAAMAARLAELSAEPRRASFFSDWNELGGRTGPLAEEARRAAGLLNAGEPAAAAEAFAALRARLPAPRSSDDESFALAVDELLAVSHLRRGERDNCAARHTSVSCILPLSAGAVHDVKDGSRAAAAAYERLLARKDLPRATRLSSIWLLNLARMTLGEHPAKVPERWRIPAEAFAPSSGTARFPRFPDEAGERALATFGLAGGVVIEDFDGDGDLDVLSSSMALDVERGQLKYFANDGKGFFADRTKEAGLEGLTGGLNLSAGDYDEDGRPDVLVLRGGWLRDAGLQPPSLLRNLGGGRFADVTKAAGLYLEAPANSGAWADYDGDGDLDLFLALESGPWGKFPSRLYRNDGDGTFTDAARKAGLEVEAFVKGAAWGDYDGDGRPDLYLSVWGADNQLWRNLGGGRFEEVAAKAGVTGPKWSFPAWFWDFDDDGRDDIFVSGYVAQGAQQHAAAEEAADRLGLPFESERPRLYRNEGGGKFTDVAEKAGLAHPIFAMGSSFGDLDNDGRLDMYLATGAPDFRALTPNRMYRNAGGGRFQDVTAAGGFGHLQKGHAVSFADLDGDGDQDVYADIGGFFADDAYPNALFVNPGAPGRWVKLSLEGERPRTAVGARVELDARLKDGSVRTLHRTVGFGSSFGYQTLEQHVGLGDAEGIEEIRVRWPSGRGETVRGAIPGKRYIIREGRGLAAMGRE